MKKSEIKITVALNERNQPEEIQWQAEGSGMEGLYPCKSVMLSIWENAGQGTLRIDLWTHQMMVNEMQQFIYETMQSMAGTYQRATSDESSAELLRNMAVQFGKKTGLIQA